MTVPGTRQELLEPGARLQVEVVGGLVEQQHVGRCSSKLASATRICQPPDSSPQSRSMSASSKPSPCSTVSASASVS
jgi:hypothetical protein